MTPTPITKLAEHAEVSRRQVRRDLAAGAPADLRGYLAWRREREPDPRTAIAYALARGVDLWNAYEHQRSRYADRAGLAALREEIMRRLRAAFERLPARFVFVSWCTNAAQVRADVVRELRDELYSVGQLAYMQLAARKPDPPEPLRRPSDGTLAGVRAWVREAQAARVRMRTDIRDGLLIPVLDLEYDVMAVALEARAVIFAAAGRIAVEVGRRPEEAERPIREALEWALREADSILGKLEMTRKGRR